jgi:hypothetical protein
VNLYRVLTVKIKTEIPEKTIELALFALELEVVLVIVLVIWIGHATF